eukprot:3230500-Lingulodinium_polyedra.AAC.1
MSLQRNSQTTSPTAPRKPGRRHSRWQRPSNGPPRAMRPQPSVGQPRATGSSWEPQPATATANARPQLH